MTTDVKPRETMPTEARTLPARYYTDPAVFRKEMERFFFGMWISAGRADQIPSPGDYFLRDVIGESVIVARGEDLRVRAFYNVCRHRGTKLCTESAGRFPGTIQCPYHSWTYGLDGCLVGAPHMDEVPHFRREDNPLRTAACDVWDGHIFISLADTPAPLRDQLAGLPTSSPRGEWPISASGTGSSTTSRRTGS